MLILKRQYTTEESAVTIDHVIVVYMRGQINEMYVQKSAFDLVVAPYIADYIPDFKFGATYDEIALNWKKLYSDEPRIKPNELLVHRTYASALDQTDGHIKYAEWLKSTFDEIDALIKSVNLNEAAVTLCNQAFQNFLMLEKTVSPHHEPSLFNARDSADGGVLSPKLLDATVEGIPNPSTTEVSVVLDTATAVEEEDAHSTVYSIEDDDGDEDDNEDSGDVTMIVAGPERTGGTLTEQIANINRTTLNNIRRMRRTTTRIAPSRDVYVFIATTPYYKCKSIYAIGTAKDIVETLRRLNEYRIEGDKFYYSCVLHVGRHTRNCFDYITSVYQSQRVDDSSQLFRLSGDDSNDIIDMLSRFTNE
ncbi:bro-g [Leucania separata nucleopolyhedrovirus]|uniref:Bro-g n=1 Tax=Leucania separata nucleopolyhedrovirus TaxID=1307956 RepID=Q0IKZ2_NPVLS|nr:bro-g [Leucania separata nucleopolyhedrovirus]AAR28891.1 bro-g [Leucania separata nucleopolyhedrovirus]